MLCPNNGVTLSRKRKQLPSATTGLNLKRVMLSGNEATLHNRTHVTLGRDNTTGTTKNHMFGEDSYHEGTPGDVAGGGDGL